MSGLAHPQHWLVLIRRWSTEKAFEAKDWLQETICHYCLGLYDSRRRESSLMYLRSNLFDDDCRRLEIDPDFLRRALIEHAPNVTREDITR